MYFTLHSKENKKEESLVSNAGTKYDQKIQKIRTPMKITVNQAHIHMSNHESTDISSQFVFNSYFKTTK